jgi:hypothetical protein
MNAAWAVPVLVVSAPLGMMIPRPKQYSYVGSGPTLTDEERRAVGIVLRLHDRRER